MANTTKTKYYNILSYIIFFMKIPNIINFYLHNIISIS